MVQLKKEIQTIYYSYMKQESRIKYSTQSYKKGRFIKSSMRIYIYVYTYMCAYILSSSMHLFLRIHTYTVYVHIDLLQLGINQSQNIYHVWRYLKKLNSLDSD